MDSCENLELGDNRPIMLSVSKNDNSLDNIEQYIGPSMTSSEPYTEVSRDSSE